MSVTSAASDEGACRDLCSSIAIRTDSFLSTCTCPRTDERKSLGNSVCEGQPQAQRQGLTPTDQCFHIAETCPGSHGMTSSPARNGQTSESLGCPEKTYWWSIPMRGFPTLKGGQRFRWNGWLQTQRVVLGRFKTKTVRLDSCGGNGVLRSLSTHCCPHTCPHPGKGCRLCPHPKRGEEAATPGGGGAGDSPHTKLGPKRSYRRP